MVLVATRSKIPWWRMRHMDHFAKTLTSAWRRVDGQLWMFLAVICRSIEYLHDDMSYVLIGGQR